MPLLIFHCRIRLFLVIIQQRTILGGAPTIRLQEQPMNFTLISLHAFQYILAISEYKKKVNINFYNELNFFYRLLNR